MIYDRSSAVGMALLAPSSQTCALPLEATVEKLDSSEAGIGRAEPLCSAEGCSWFEQHQSFRLPCDASSAVVRRTYAGQSDTLHRFVLDASIAEPLNERLVQIAFSLQRKPEESGRAKSNVGGWQSRATLFESREDARTDRELGCCRALNGAVRAAIAELRCASGLNVAGCADGWSVLAAESAEVAGTDAAEGQTYGSRSGGGGGGGGGHGAPTGSCGACSSADTSEHDHTHVRTQAPPLAERDEWLTAMRAAHSQMMQRYGGVGWLNVNQPGGDSNKLHIHDPTRLSVVYFVSDGRRQHAPANEQAGGVASWCQAPRKSAEDGMEHSTEATQRHEQGLMTSIGASRLPPPPSTAEALSGHLCFRGGKAYASSRATHSFLPAAPQPGSLWLFPGAVPHCVLPYHSSEADMVQEGKVEASPDAAGAAGADSCTQGGMEVEVQLQAAPRISVAINLLDAAPPPIRAYPGPGLPASLGGLYSV